MTDFEQKNPNEMSEFEQIKYVKENEFNIGRIDNPSEMVQRTAIDKAQEGYGALGGTLSAIHNPSIDIIDRCMTYDKEASYITYWPGFSDITAKINNNEMTPKEALKVLPNELVKRATEILSHKDAKTSGLISDGHAWFGDACYQWIKENIKYPEDFKERFQMGYFEEKREQYQFLAINSAGNQNLPMPKFEEITEFAQVAMAIKYPEALKEMKAEGLAVNDASQKILDGNFKDARKSMDGRTQMAICNYMPSICEKFGIGVKQTER